jgi:hypothetical protein
MEAVINYELLKLLKEYESGKKRADDNFIKRALKIILRNQYQLLENVFVGDNVYLFDDPIYNEKDQTIYFKSSFDIHEVAKNYLLSDNDKLLIYNLFILKNVIEISLNIMKNETINSGFGKKILLLEDDFKSQDISLINRIIGIDATRRVSELAGWMNFDERDFALNYFYFESINALLNGYLSNLPEDCPVNQYFIEYNEYLKQKKDSFPCDQLSTEDLIRISKRYSSSENFYSGLPVDCETYNCVITKRNEAQSILLRKRN